MLIGLPRTDGNCVLARFALVSPLRCRYTLADSFSPLLLHIVLMFSNIIQTKAENTALFDVMLALEDLVEHPLQARLFAI